MMDKLILPLGTTHKLREWANNVKFFYGHSVYLVGSQLTDKPNPRDVDIVCIIPDIEFEYRYGSVFDWIEEGDTGQWTDVRWIWSRDCVQRWREGCIYTKMNLDFKVLPRSYHDQIYLNKPIYQLDNCVDIYINKSVIDMSSYNRKWRVDWENRIIYMSRTINNKDLIALFSYLSTESVDQMIADGPLAEWTIVTLESN